MSKKMFNLVIGVTGGVAAIASAVVTYMQPAYIGIGSTAVTEICSLFVKNE